MPTLTLPRLGETMESGRVVAWLKQPGEAFRRGETLVEIESDKTVVELPALADGTLTEILATAGSDIDVGADLCRYTGRESEAAPVVAEPPPPPPAPPVVTQSASASGIRATPVARRLAARQGVSIDDVTGTGRRGRVEARDIVLTRADATGLDLPGGRLATRAWSPERGIGTVLLHGFAGDGQAWEPLASTLANTGGVMAVDLPGHGETTIAAPDIASLVAAIVALLRSLPGPVHLVGHSLGGVVAVRAARVARVARLTLMAPAGLDTGIDAEFVAGMAAGRAGDGLGHLIRRLAVRPPPISAAALDTMAAELGRGRLAELARALIADGRQQVDIVPDLRALDAPVWVIWGLADRIIPWAQVAHVGSRAAVHLIPDAGHMAHWDKPDEVASLLA